MRSHSEPGLCLHHVSKEVYICYKHIELAVSGVLELAEDLKQATGNYDLINIVEKGGFGSFKGLFCSTNIAVKLLNTVRINSPWV